MAVQLLALAGMTLLFLRERRLYLERRDRDRARTHVRQERLARERVAPFRPHVEAAPVAPPASVHPIAWAPSRRQHDGRHWTPEDVA